MSQDNVELVHRIFEAFNRRDLDAALALIDDDVEFGSRLARPARRQHGGSPRHAGPGVLTVAPGKGVEHEREPDPGDRQDSGDPGRDTPSSHPPIMLPFGRRNNRAAPWLRSSGGTCPTRVLVPMPSDRGGHSFEMSGQLSKGHHAQLT